MKARVKLFYSVELSVEGSSEDSIMDWLRCMTPEDVRDLVGASQVTESYDEDILYKLQANAPVDYVIGG